LAFAFLDDLSQLTFFSTLLLSSQTLPDLKLSAIFRPKILVSLQSLKA